MSVAWTVKRSGFYRLDHDGCVYVVSQVGSCKWRLSKYWDGVEFWTLPASSLRGAVWTIGEDIGTTNIT